MVIEDNHNYLDKESMAIIIPTNLIKCYLDSFCFLKIIY